MMQTHFEMNWLTFLGKPLNILCDMVQVWNSLFLEVVNKYAPIKQHRVKNPDSKAG